MPFSPKLGLTLAALAILGSAGTGAHAQTTFYNFQFKRTGAAYTGTGAAAGSGATWNVISSPGGTTTFTNALDSSGASSTVSFAFNSPGLSSISNATSATTSDPNVLLDQYARYVSATPGQFTLSGLTANVPVSLYLYDVDGNFNDRKATFALTDSTFTTSMATASTTAGNNTTFNNPQNYVLLTGTTDANGKVYGTYVGILKSSTYEADFNGLQLAITPPAAAPEPSQLTVFALGLLGLGRMALTARRRTLTV